MPAPAILTAPVAAPVATSYWRLVSRRLARDPATLIAGSLLGAIVLAAVLAPALAPYDPAAGSIRMRLSPIGTVGHPLGTDEQGRDMLSRLLFGGRMTLLAELTPIVVACLFGGVLGILAGYLGGAANSIIMRASDIFYAFPPILVFTSTQVSLSIILAAGLSFLGLGVTPPAAEWGLMLNTLRQSIYVDAWVPALPGVAIFVVSMAFNLLSDGLRDAMEVRG